MKTPAGNECNFFYGDYYRGREHEECRLLDSSWVPRLCVTCPVPGIGQANACEKMTLRATVIRPVESLFQKRVKIAAFCEKTGKSGFDPHIGCGECHPVPFVFEVKN